MVGVVVVVVVCWRVCWRVCCVRCRLGTHPPPWHPHSAVLRAPCGSRLGCACACCGVQSKVMGGAYGTLFAFVRDVRLIFHNCLLFNTAPDCRPIRAMATTLSTAFEEWLMGLVRAYCCRAWWHSVGQCLGGGGLWEGMVVVVVVGGKGGGRALLACAARD